MPTFIYEAKTMDGVVVKGKMDSIDERSVTSALRQKNYFPMAVKLYSPSMNINIGDYRRVSIKDISIFCRQFAFIITSGIPILRALEIVKEQTEHPKLRKILINVFEDVQTGRSLSDSMKKHKDIPFMLSDMIAVGEASGTLDRIMLRMADYYDKDYKQKQKIRSAMTYPIMVSIFAVIIVIILVVKVLPTFIGMINSTGGTLPGPTKIILALSDFLRTKGLIFLIILIPVIIMIKVYFKNNAAAAQAYDKFKLSIPIFGKLFRKIITARFARTFGSLIASGVPLIKSIEICTAVLGNSYLEDVLSTSKEDIKKGGSIGESLEVKKVFPLMLTQMIKIGEESGTLDTILEKTAEFYDGEVETATQQLTIMIEPIIIIILAVVVGFIVLAMIMPMFEMFNSLSNTY